MFEGLLTGLHTAFSIENVLFLMTGCFAGTFIGMLPGLGPMTAIALICPTKIGLDDELEF